MAAKPSRGIINGKTIELIDDPGIKSGQEAEVIVRVRKTDPPWGQGPLNSAGAMTPYWTPEDDKILVELERDRRQPSGREIAE
jgi:hypothetical protein